MNTNHITDQPAVRLNGSAPHPPTGPDKHRPTRAERKAAAAVAEAEAARIRDEARRERERRQEEWAAERARLREERRREQQARRDRSRSDRAVRWRERLSRWWHTFVLVGAIVGVNAVAVVGQVTAFTAAVTATPPGFGWSVPLALATAAVIESIAIYVGWHAHTALVEGDSVMRLRLTSYAIAAGVGALNYHHYAPTWAPSDMAIMFGSASLLSPWLWAMHSRHQHRGKLREQGLIDPRAPKFSALRWLLWRAETWQALRWAVRHGEQSPAAAIIGVHVERATSEAADLSATAGADVVAAQAALIRAQSAALEAARLCPPEGDGKNTSSSIASTPQSTPAALEVFSSSSLPPTGGEAGAENASSSIEKTPKDVLVVGRENATPPETAPEDVSDADTEASRERRDEQDNRAAEKWVRERMRAGRLPTLGDVADKYGRSKTWARSRVQAARDHMTARGYVVRPGNVVVPPAGGDGVEDAEETAGGTS